MGGLPYAAISRFSLSAQACEPPHLACGGDVQGGVEVMCVSLMCVLCVYVCGVWCVCVRVCVYVAAKTETGGWCVKR